MLFLAALSYFAHIAIKEKPFASGHASIAVDIIRFDVGVELLGPQLGYSFSLGVIIFLGCQKSGAFTANCSTNGDHFVHISSLCPHAMNTSQYSI